MQRLTDGIILFHGSYCEVKEPDLSQCAAMKDFGRGFYLTTSEKQAEDFVRPSIRKAAAQGLISPNQNYNTGTRRNKVFINFMKLLAYCSYPLTYVILYVILFDVIKVE